MARGVSLEFILQGNRNLVRSLRLFSSWVIFQAFLGFLRTGSLVVPLVGCLAYLLPLVMLWLSYFYFETLQRFDRLITLYVLCSIIAAAGLLLSLMGFDWPILQSVGQDLLITATHVEGGVLRGHAGFLRSPEIAAWHMATAISAIITLTFLRLDQGRWPLWLLSTIPFLLAGSIVTGRRKALVVIIAFLLIYLLLTTLLGQRRGRFKLIAGLGLTLTLLLVLQGFVADSPLDSYLARSNTTFESEELGQRIQVLGLSTIPTAIQVGGYLGLGAGVASQGAQQYVSGYSVGAAEGGLGKIVLELGLPGLLLGIWLVWQLGWYIWLVLRQVQQVNPQNSPLVVAATAFVLANLAMYTIATQVFGDPFVLIILGTCLGFVLAAPRLLVWPILTYAATNPAGWCLPPELPGQHSAHY